MNIKNDDTQLELWYDMMLVLPFSMIGELIAIDGHIFLYFYSSSKEAVLSSRSQV